MSVWDSTNWDTANWDSLNADFVGGSEAYYYHYNSSGKSKKITPKRQPEEVPVLMLQVSSDDVKTVITESQRIIKALLK